MGWVVTIDGPAASGKSSVSRELAKKLNCQWVSTGAFYRGLAFAALQLQIDLEDVTALAKLSQDSIWKVVLTREKTQVFFEEQEVTDLIAHEDVGSFASKVSHYPEVRKALLEAQRQCAMGTIGLVAEGRDCGTIVFPKAEAKVYLTANSAHRAARRAAEQGSSAEEILEAQRVRDEQDSQRKEAPLQVPEDSFFVDTTRLNLEEVLREVEKYVRGKLSPSL